VASSTRRAQSLDLANTRRERFGFEAWQAGDRTHGDGRVWDSTIARSSRKAPAWHSVTVNLVGHAVVGERLCSTAN